jgi:hypothetical protein
MAAGYFFLSINVDIWRGWRPFSWDGLLSKHFRVVGS